MESARLAGATWVSGPDETGWFEGPGGLRSDTLCLAGLRYDGQAKEMVLKALRQAVPERSEPAVCGRTGLRRWQLETKVVLERHDRDMSDRVQQYSAMRSHPEGEWVRWVDAAGALAAMEERIPEVRIARLEKALGLVSKGLCPECGRPVRDWEAPSGLLAPEAYATLREMDVDPGTGHKVGCSLNKGVK